MNSVQCPICGLQLEGDFEDTDEVKCPSCLATFVPSRIRHTTVAKSRTNSIPQQTHYPQANRGPSRPPSLIWAFIMGLVGEFLVAGLAFLVFLHLVSYENTSENWVEILVNGLFAIAIVVWYPLLISTFRGNTVGKRILSLLFVLRILLFLPIVWKCIRVYLFAIGTRMTETSGIVVVLILLAFIVYQILIVCLINSASVEEWFNAKQTRKQVNG